MKKTALRQYAKLIARTGANVQKGQEVWLRAGLDQPEFVKMLVEECYRCGAKRVAVDWGYDPLTKVHARYQSVKTLSVTEDWEIAKYEHMAEIFPVRIFLESEDPDGLSGIHPRYFKAIQKRSAIYKKYRDMIDTRHQWCIAAVPGEAWAKKMYPALSRKQAVEQLWKDILYTSRADGADPVADWAAHNADLRGRCDALNAMQLRSLHYTASNGTDLTVGLLPRSRFCAGADTTRQGVMYNANIPTEECFVTPDRNATEGIVYSTKPLSYHGCLIENFSIRFEKGRAAEVKAEKNEQVLRDMIGMDEGAHYLGEAALVPKESPISASGLLFYSTLFDENASCHLALGDGYAECIDGFEELSDEDMANMGVNSSIIHTDFMIGCDDLAIDGITEDGRTVAIFRDGTWAI